MTPKERAEKMHDESGCECSLVGRDRHIEWFAAQIAEAVEETTAFADARVDNAVFYAKAAAYEDAAKIAETCLDPKTCKSEFHDPRWCQACEYGEDAGNFIAEQIRSRSKEVL